MFEIEASKTVRMMGTTIDLTVTAAHQPGEIIDGLIERLEKYNLRFSANDETSELSAVNKLAGIKPIVVHKELFRLIQIGKRHSLAKGSLLNIAIGPLVKLWRIGFHDARVPSKAEINERLPLTNPEDIELDEAKQAVYLKTPGMEIDLGALAKGYIADRLLDYLKVAGAQSALLNLGGNVVTFGPQLQRADSLWRIGIQNPKEPRGDLQVVLKVPEKSVVTSGIYERQLKKDDQVFHHIFDSLTGYPVETDIASLTIVSDLSVDGEIWTTRLFGQAKEKIIEKVNELSAIEALVITKSGDLFWSNGLDAYL